MKRLLAFVIICFAGSSHAEDEAAAFPSWVRALPGFPISGAETFLAADDSCAVRPDIKIEPGTPWYGPQNNFEHSFCAGFLAARNSARAGGTCGDAKGPFASGRWHTGVLAFFSAAPDLGKRRIAGASACEYIKYTPSAGLIKQCTTSLYCNLRHAPNRGVILWPRVDVGGVYLGKAVEGLKGESLFGNLSGGISLGYWWSPRSWDFRVLTGGLSVATALVDGKETPGEKTPSYPLVRASIFASVVQNVFALEWGVYRISADAASLPADIQKEGNFFRISINIADLPNLIGTKAASQISDSIDKP